MTNQSFFINKGPFSLNHLANSIKATSYLNGKKIDIIDPKIMVSNICTLEKASSNELSFFTNAKYAEQYIKSQPLACITSEKFLSKAPKDVFILITSNPYADFARIMTLLSAHRRIISMNAKSDNLTSIAQVSYVEIPSKCCSI